MTWLTLLVMHLSAGGYSFLADALLALHFAYVAFVVLGLLLIWVGFFLKWNFVRNFAFRIAHLLAMAVVAFEAVTGSACPLTVWEDKLRLLAGGGQSYRGSFLEHWLHQLMFFEASEMTFRILHALFFALILLSLWLVKPRWPKRAP